MRWLINSLIFLGMVILVPYILMLTLVSIFSLLIENAIFGKMSGSKVWWRKHEKTQKNTQAGDN